MTTVHGWLGSRSSRRIMLGLALLLLLVLSGCSDDGNDSSAVTVSERMPSWVQEVDPPPGSSSFVPDAVTVRHSITSTDEDVRLVIDGVDVTTYAAFDAGLLSYVPDTGPVDLAPGEHFATVQRVTLPVEGADYGVLDSYTWKFNID